MRGPDCPNRTHTITNRNAVHKRLPSCDVTELVSRFNGLFAIVAGRVAGAVLIFRFVGRKSASQSVSQSGARPQNEFVCV